MPAVGGVARRATTINQEKKKNPYTLVLDAGDSLVGDQDPALKTQGKSSVEAMNRLGYDAMALGPGDLALGLDDAAGAHGGSQVPHAVGQRGRHRHGGAGGAAVHRP